MNYTAIIEKTSDGWYAVQCQELPSAISQGKSIEEALQNITEAIKLVLDYEKEKTLEGYKDKKIIRRKVSV